MSQNTKTLTEEKNPKLNLSDLQDFTEMIAEALIFS